MAEPSITICPGCQRRYRLAAEHLGKMHRCKHCGTEFMAAAGRADANQPMTLKPLSVVPITGGNKIISPSSVTITGSNKIISPSSSVRTGSSPVVAPGSLGSWAGTGMTGSISSRMTRATDESRVPSEWQVGDRILDLYEVMGILGAGAMGKVYRVKHLGWNLELAVKSPRPDVLTRSGIENFEREAEVWVGLGLHPHIVTCYYVRRLGGIPRVFAEFVQGGSLQDWIRKGKLTDVIQMVDIAIQFAWGLQYSHDQGLIHQDIKPDNVMMTETGVAKVTDFGLARARSGSEGISMNSDDLTQTSDTGTLRATLGGMTPAYCSPEQLRGAMLARAGIPREDRPKLTRKTDIWSWAVSILEMFMGRVTWQGGERAYKGLLDYRRQRERGTLTLPIMPDALDQILEDCFQEEPQDRPRDMAEIATRLQAIYETLTGKPYARLAPRADRGLADSLNNRAVSLVDLGKRHEAQRLWDEALRADPQHLESLYNRGLILWRSGHINDDALVESLTQKAQEWQILRPEEWLPSYLISHVHLERRAPQAVHDLLVQLPSPLRNEPFLQEIAAMATQTTSTSHQRLQHFHAHEAPIMAMAVHPPYVLSGSEDHTVKVWDLQGKAQRSLVGHSDVVTALAISGDGLLAYSGSRDGTIRVWDLAKGQTVRILTSHTNGIHSLSWHPNYLLSGSYDNTIRLWDHQRGESRQVLTGHAWTAAAASSDGNYLFSCGYKSLRSWEQQSGDSLNTLTLDQTVYRIHLDQQAQYALLASGHPNINAEMGHDLELWQVVKGKRARKFKGHHSGITALWLSPDHQTAISGSRDCSLKIWEVKTGRCLCTLTGEASSINALAVSPDQQYLALGRESGTIDLWHLDWSSSGMPAPFMLSRIQDSEAVLVRELAYEQALAQAREWWEQGDPLGAAQQVALARSQQGSRRRREAMDQWAALYLRLPRHNLQDAWLLHTQTLESAVTAIALSLQQDRVWAGCEDHTIRSWDPANGKEPQILSGHTGPITTLAHHGQWLLSGSEDHTLKLWDPQSGQCLQTFTGHSAYVTACGITPYQAISGSYHDQTLRCWDLTTGRLLNVLSDRIGVTSLAVSWDHRQLLVSGYEMIQRWDLRRGECVQTLTGVKDMIRSIALSTDQRFALAGSYDHTVSLWDLRQGICLRTLAGHTDWVNTVQFSFSGKYGFSGSRDRTIKIWDLSSGECIHTFAGHQNSINAVAVARDLRWVISGSQDKTGRCWFLDWELAAPPDVDWDPAIQPYLEHFLANGSGDIAELHELLSWAGYGWMSLEQVEMALAASWPT